LENDVNGGIEIFHLVLKKYGKWVLKLRGNPLIEHGM